MTYKVQEQIKIPNEQAVNQHFNDPVNVEKKCETRSRTCQTFTAYRNKQKRVGLKLCLESGIEKIFSAFHKHFVEINAWDLFI